MEKKNYLRKTLALVMAFLMIVTMMPVNIFAETKKADWTINETKEAEMSFWRLSNKNELTVVSNGEGIKTPSINYIGTYVNDEGRTVIRLSYRVFQNLASGVWQKALFKFDSDLYNLIDFGNTGTGMYKEAVNGRWHDHADYNEIVAFTNVVSSTSGAVHVKEQSLKNNGNKTGANARLEIPIDLVLLKGKTVDNLVGQPHIQMRITNDDYSEVFCVAGTGKASSDPTNNDDSAVDPDTLVTPYNSYTFMTYVPSKNNNADVNTVSDYNMDYQFYSANSYAKYNEEGGYLDVFHKQSKMNSADNIGGENFAFRQVFNEKFAEVLKPQDESGTVAEVFTASQQGDKWGTTKPIYITKAQLNTSENSDLNPGFTGIQVASTFKNSTIGQKFAGLNTVLTTTKPQESFLNSATTEFNSGLPTITRYYIDKDLVAEKGLKKDDLAAFDFYSTFILDGTKKFIEYTATNDTGADIVLAPNSKLGLTYADNPTSTPNTGLVKYSLTFGDDAYKIELRSNFKHVGTLLNGNDVGRAYEYTLIPGMTIKAGEKITFRTMKYDTPPTSVTLTLPGKDGAKKIVLKPGENGPEVNTPRRLNFITTYAGGSATQSGLNPDIDELFTDSTNITGRTRYKLAVIKLFYPDGSEYPFTIADQDTRTEMNINGAKKNVNAYTFTTEGKSGFTMPAVVKDSVIGITNTDVRKAAVPSEKVFEKVQAKVTFDLNGGKLPTTTKSFEGFDTTKLPGTEFAYKLQRTSDTAPVVRIAPMNEKTAGEEGYTPNGFKVDKYIDHNGDELTGDALELRKIVKEKPELAERSFLGWTTQKLEGTPEEVSTAFKALQEATTADQVNGDKNFIFTATSPITKETTVYAAYGVEDTTDPTIGDLDDDNNPDTPVPQEEDENNKGPQVWANGARVVEGQKIKPIKVNVTDDKDKNPTVEVTGLPEGLEYNAKTGMIEGTPKKLTDWADKEEKDFTATIKATDEAENEATKEITITVLRDTDGDGIPDTTDPDDDNDGTNDDKDKNPKKWDANVEGKVTTPKGTQPTVDQYKEKITNLPKGSTVVVKTEPDVSKAGETTAVVTVTLPNGEEVDVTVPVTVTDTTPTTCLTQDGLQKQFEDAIDPMFDGIKKKDGVYEGTYDKTNKIVTVKILDKTKPFSELKGTGLIAGLTKLYKENHLVKVQVGSQDERDLIAIYTASGNDTVFMHNIAQIIGPDIGNEVNGQGSNIKTLADFIDKTVTLKLTVAQENCGTNPVELIYTIKGVDGTDTTPTTCLTQDGLQKQFEDAIDPMFDGIKKKDGVYEGTYDKTNKIVTVKILDKTKPFSELKGTGLIAGLTKLYKENHLVKVQVGSQDERDLIAIYTASGNDTVFMHNIAQIIGPDIGNEVNGQGSNIKTLADFIDKTVTLKLTVAQENCGTNPVELIYTIKGVDGTDTTAPAAPKVTANDDGSVTVIPPTDADTKTVTVKYKDNDGNDKTVTATKDGNGKWTVPAGSEVEVNETSGVITIPEDKVKDNTEVTATAKDGSNNESTEGKATAKGKGTPYPPTPSYNYLTLTLDENYRGGRISDYDVYEGELIDHYLYIPHRRGYVFEGWSYNSRRLDEVKPGDGIYYPTTLYAIWSNDRDYGRHHDRYDRDKRVEEPEDLRPVGEHKAYMFGYTDGTVRPNGKITRAEAAALVTRLLGLDTFASAAKPVFSDTPSSWYNKAINAAVQRGIMKGYPDGRFRPNAPITRAEFTQMISTIDNKPYGVAPFADVKGHWAERPIGSEYQAGRIMGYPDQTFRPNAFITRCEAVVILNKMFERNYDAMSLKDAKNAYLIKGFIDLPTSFWGYYDMIEATNSHSFKRRSEGRVQEDWTLVK